MTRAASGEPPIHFYAHQARAGEAGAREDFEQMIALLVEAVRGDARLVFAHGGDWGIDALVGDLNGRVTIWQAKYFPHGVTNRHRGQIEGSFASAVRNASQHGYQIQEWVLCVPSSLDPQMSQWWDNWRQTQTRLTRVQLVLWDETGLRNELMRPAARYVRRAYYHPYQDAGDEDSGPPKTRNRSWSHPRCYADPPTTQRPPGVVVTNAESARTATCCTRTPSSRSASTTRGAGERRLPTVSSTTRFESGSVSSTSSETRRRRSGAATRYARKATCCASSTVRAGCRRSTI
ncbi:hypothetical protein GCM10027605_44840 [Micromonospora zhanjiangensis]